MLFMFHSTNGTGKVSWKMKVVSLQVLIYLTYDGVFIDFIVGVCVSKKCK